jgi:hypothetical protein
MRSEPNQNADVLASIAGLKKLKASRPMESNEFDRVRMSKVADGINGRMVEGVTERIVGDVKRVIETKENDLAA